MTLNDTAPDIAKHFNGAYQSPDFTWNFPALKTEGLKEFIDGKKTVRDLIQDHPELLPSANNLEKGLLIIKPVDTSLCRQKEKRRGIWLCGVAGTGKTTFTETILDQMMRLGAQH